MISLPPGIAAKQSLCEWKQITKGKHMFHMCLRRETDVVSDAIKMNGYWADCIPLVRIYHRGAFDGYVDAGANIGACALLIQVARHSYHVD